MAQPQTWPVLELAGTWRAWPGAGTGAAPAPFPNHDCVDLPLPVLDWDALRDGLQQRTLCQHTRRTNTLHCAATLEGWQEEVLRLLRPWGQSYRSAYEALDHVFPAAYAECPLGTLVLYTARILMCLLEGDLACFVSHSSWISAELYKVPLTVTMGSDWPIFALLHSYDWSFPGIPRGNDYDCEHSDRSTLDWPQILGALQEDDSRPGASWWLDLLRYTFDDNLATSMYARSSECLYGVYVLNLLKAMWSADTESSAFRIYEPYVQWIHYESLHLLGASRWRIFELLHHFTSLRRHNFRLDFTTQELAALPFRGASQWLQSLSPSQHSQLLPRLRGRFASQAYDDLHQALTNVLARLDPSEPRLIYVTMVYGAMNRFIEGWVQRLKILHVETLVMATLDAEAYDLCRKHHGLCVRGRISVLNKYTLLLVALQLGFDVMWLDFDIFLVRNPTPAVQEATKGYDLLMGYDLESDCLCNGFFFMRATERTHGWLFAVVQWLYNRPYEHDQRAMAAFLNYTERISLDSKELPPIPRWHVFNEENAFINFGPWLGNFDELVLVHFVDGSAFSLYGRPASDPSVPMEKVDSNRQETAGDVMDEFYQPEVVQASPEQLPFLPPGRRLMERRMLKPPKKQKCGILPHVVSAHSGYGWLAEHGSRAVPPW